MNFSTRNSGLSSFLARSNDPRDVREGVFHDTRYQFVVITRFLAAAALKRIIESIATSLNPLILLAFRVITKFVGSRWSMIVILFNWRQAIVASRNGKETRLTAVVGDRWPGKSIEGKAKEDLTNEQSPIARRIHLTGRQKIM